MKKIFIALLGVFLLLGISLALGQRARRNQVPNYLTEKKIRVGNFDRQFYLFEPQGISNDKPIPLLFVFHGGGGNALQMERGLGFTDIARKDGFIVVYPNGIGGNWNDGRDDDFSKAHKEKIDDLSFVKAIIDSISKAYPIDQKRIYATGISNGGIFSHYVGANLADKFAAIAPVVGGIADPFSSRFDPSEPVSVLVIQGTDDKLVPYDGGGIGFGRRNNRGKIISTDKAIDLWIKCDSTNVQPKRGNLPDSDRRDGCTVETFLWENEKTIQK